MARGRMKKWREVAPRPKAFVLFIEEDLRGLEASGLT
jgi:hypothetical protein